MIPAADGSSALDAAAAHDGAIDLLLTDVIMPGLNGRELADQFATIAPGAASCSCPGYAGEALSAQGVLDPSVAFLAKPFVPAELARKVREVLDGARAPPDDRQRADRFSALRNPRTCASAGRDSAGTPDRSSDRAHSRKPRPVASRHRPRMPAPPAQPRRHGRRASRLSLSHHGVTRGAER